MFSIHLLKSHYHKVKGVQYFSIMIRHVVPTDAKAIANIYNHYIANTAITFEETPVTEADIRKRIESVLESGLPWLTVEVDNSVVGYAYATKWKDRSAYRYSVETSVYLSENTQGQGWGKKLYQALFEQLKKRSIRTAIGGVTLPNPASVALHEKLGMKKVAHFERVGFKFDQWLDVGYWQIDLSD